MKNHDSTIREKYTNIQEDKLYKTVEKNTNNNTTCIEIKSMSTIKETLQKGG
jgi:hypothetical protein